ncbi:MAG: helix-turn-helix domain-containing protein [Spirochaetales bacterium]|nr:helix-turn-helix domain-containing protein [Spirochaetales bacterium]
MTEQRPGIVGRLLRERRAALGLSRHEVVVQAGYRNVAKGLRRLVAIERGEDLLPDDRVLATFGQALGVAVEALAAAKCEQFTLLDQEPAPGQPLSLIVRYVPAVYQRITLPADMGLEEAKEFAQAFSDETGFKTCLPINSVRAIYFVANGGYAQSYGLPSQQRDLFASDAPQRWRERRQLARAVQGTKVERTE